MPQWVMKALALAHGNIDKRTLFVLLGLSLGEHGGTHKSVALGKAFRVGLEGAGGVDDGVRVVVALHQREGALDLIAEGAQSFQLLGDLGQAGNHIVQLAGAVFHIFGGQLIEREGAGGYHHGNLVLPRVQLAPEAGGVGVDDVGLKALELAVEVFVHRAGGTDVLNRHFGGGNIFQVLLLLGGQLGQKAGAGDKFGARGFDFLLEFVKGIEADNIAALNQFGGDGQHGVGVTGCGNAKKCDLFHASS